MVKPAGWSSLLVLASGIVSFSQIARTQDRAVSESTAHDLVTFLLTAQHPRTGLLASFPSSADARLEHVAFTYDVAVSALVLAHQGNLTAASRALEIFRTMALPDQERRVFNTAYHIQTAHPTLEYRLHGGPLFWVAIALMRVGELLSRPEDIEKGIRLLEWAKEHLDHFDGGIVMGIEEPWCYLMSVENNWVYVASLRIAIDQLPDGARRRALMEEEREIRMWLARNLRNRGDGDSVKALDVYTHALLIGPDAHLDVDSRNSRGRVAAWGRAWLEELNELFQVPQTARYDYTDACEASRLGRSRAGWLEGTEQVVVAFLTWAPFFEALGDSAMARRLRIQAALSHGEVLSFAVRNGRTLAIPNTDAPQPFQTFMDGWIARPRKEPALNGTNWTYFAEVGYNPFTTPLPRPTRSPLRSTRRTTPAAR